MVTTANTVGKGSRPRPLSVSRRTFDQNWSKIFGDKKLEQLNQAQATAEDDECWCERSPTGMCIGWHNLSEEEYQQELLNYNKENN
jgi:hypothetical protein